MEKANKSSMLRLKFGGKEISLEPARAKKYALLGLECEKHKNAIDMLKLISNKQGISPNEFMEKLLAERHDALKKAYLEKLNGDEELAEKLTQLEGEFTPKADNQLAEIKKAFSQYQEIDDLPDEVVLISELNNISLFDALLRYKFFEREKAKQEEQNRQKNYKNTVGSLKTQDVDYGFSYINALLKGINN